MINRSYFNTLYYLKISTLKVFTLTVKNTSFFGRPHPLPHTETLQLDAVPVNIDGSAALINMLAVNTHEIIGLEIFDLVAEDNADITFKQSEQAGLNSIKLSSASDVTIVTGDLVIDAMSLAKNTPTLTTGAGNIAITNIDQLTATYFLSGNYDGTTGLFTTTTDGTGADTLVYEGLNADALTDNTNAVILVGVDYDDLVASHFS